MLALDMENLAYCFSASSIEEYVTENRPGNFALGFVCDDVFIVRYIGRAEENLRDKLKSYLGDAYQYFKFSYALSSREAFEKECKIYHRFGGCKKLHNLIHPSRGNHMDWKCPVCNIYE